MLSAGVSSLLTDLALIPRLGLLTTLICNGLILRLDLSHYFIHVQVAVVVHLHDDRYVLDLALELSQFLRKIGFLRLGTCKGKDSKKARTKRSRRCMFPTASYTALRNWISSWRASTFDSSSTLFM